MPHKFKILELSFFLLGIFLVLLYLFLFNLNTTTLNLQLKICDNFTHPTTKIICYAFYLENESFCRLASNFESICYDFVLTKKANEMYCKTLKDKYLQAICIKNLAMKRKDPSLCEKNLDQKFYEFCFSGLPLSFYKFYKKEYCENITHESGKYTCLAIVERNESYCENIVFELFEKPICEAVAKRNSTLCNSDSCYYQFAIFTKNLSYCEKIEESFSKAECIGTISKNLKECEKFESLFLKEICELYVLKALELEK